MSFWCPVDLHRIMKSRWGLEGHGQSRILLRRVAGACQLLVFPLALKSDNLRAILELVASTLIEPNLNRTLTTPSYI